METVLIERGRPRGIREVLSWYVRRPAARPGETLIGHSAELRTMIYLLAGAELLVEGLMDAALVPPAWRPVHLLWLAALIDLTLAFAAITRGNPHRLGGGLLRVQAGLRDGFTVPLRAVEAVRRELVSVPGRGVRAVPGSPEAVVCTVAGAAELCLDLREPLRLRRTDGTVLTARRLHLAADDPGAAHAALRAALRDQQPDS